MKYKIIVDKQSRTNPSNMKKEYVIDIEELRFKGDVHDSIVITPTEAYVIRRLSLNEYQVLSVLKKSIKEPLGDLNIELFEGENYIYLFDMEGNKFYAEYLLKSDMTDMFVTTKEMTSAINQTAQSIELSVNYKFMDYSTKEEMNTAINMKANEIQSTVSETYSTKNETATAKQEAIDSSNLSTDEKLKNYNTTTQMNSAITQKANEITSTVSKTYITKEDSSTNIANAKQEAIDGANSSTDDKLKNYSTTSQMNSAITQKANEITSTVSTNYSTKAETQTAKEGAIESANNSTDNKLKNYSTTEQMNSSITQKANEITQTVESTYETKTNVDTKINTAKSEIKQTTDSINLKVEGKVDEEDFTGANIMLAINNDNSSAVINADKISLNGKAIDLTSEDMSISSTNFSVDKDGNIKAKSGQIGGFDITENYMSCSKDDSYGYIGNMSNGNFLFIRTGTQGNYVFPFYVQEDGSVYASKMNITGGKINIKDKGTSCNLEIETESGNFKASHYSSGSIYKGQDAYVGIEAGYTLGGGSIYLAPSQSEISTGSNYTLIQNGKVDALTISQRSLESAKKNFEKLDNGLDIINNIDIYKYNLINEEDTTKKHIGFIIGKNYKYSKAITNNENDGVDIYSFVAVCCKAIQEQQEQIENQNNLIQSLIERIEKLEAK